jgi:hypothetical protein
LRFLKDLLERVGHTLLPRRPIVGVVGLDIGEELGEV